MILSSALVYSTRPRVSVFSTGVESISDSGFSWKPDYLHYRFVHARSVLSGSAQPADLPTSLNAYTL